jgi:hypothetical protein
MKMNAKKPAEIPKRFKEGNTQERGVQRELHDRGPEGFDKVARERGGVDAAAR